MASLSKLFSKYTGSLRSWRLVYVVNNFLNARKLKHNRELYEQMGLKKSIFGSISSTDFTQSSNNGIPWLDQPNAKQQMEQHPDFKQFDAATQEQLRQWIDNGYLILKGFYKPTEMDALDSEVSRLLEEQKANFNYTDRKIMDAHEVSPVINGYFRREKMLQLLNFMMGRPVHPFQTINFVQGSEQRAHSDSIHMTSEPKGYLVATLDCIGRYV